MKNHEEVFKEFANHYRFAGGYEGATRYSMGIMWEYDKLFSLWYELYLLRKYSSCTEYWPYEKGDLWVAIKHLEKKGYIENNARGSISPKFLITKKGNRRKWYIERIRVGLFWWIPLISLKKPYI